MSLWHLQAWTQANIMVKMALKVWLMCLRVVKWTWILTWSIQAKWERLIKCCRPERKEPTRRIMLMLSNLTTMDAPNHKSRLQPTHSSDSNIIRRRNISSQTRFFLKTIWSHLLWWNIARTYLLSTTNQTQVVPSTRARMEKQLAQLEETLRTLCQWQFRLMVSSN